MLCLPGLVCQQGRLLYISYSYPELWKVVDPFPGTMDECVDLCVAHTEFTCVAITYRNKKISTWTEEYGYCENCNRCILQSYSDVSHPDRLIDSSDYTYCSMQGKQVTDT